MAKNILENISKKAFTEQDNIIFDYISNNNITSLTSHELAQECYCSTATINRFCKKIGVDGFGELKILLKLNQKYAQGYNDNKLNTRNISEIREISREIKKNKPICVFGRGASSISGQYLFRQLLKLGYHVSFVMDIELFYELKGYNLIIISNSGENQFGLRLIDIVKENDVNIMSITYKNSSIDKASKYSLTHMNKQNFKNLIEREQQLHLILLINHLINALNIKD
ncbi:MurR/RpiR family transcriptional regulator [Psychrilyobacter atlanticus]|uniref:MurR/RpiR family transcriptional regulator n=1 Tax=Psychrilyobacter atlanticus TaxID=271091 RepID=UPI0004175B6E|nr:MurR/RpiR family transcriptional regulator [Psychrilyobacter atlanticus]